MTTPSDAPPTLAEPHGRCPACGYLSTFEPVGPQRMLAPRAFAGTTNESTHREVVLKCRGCQVGVVVVERKNSGGFGDDKWTGLQWWPTPVADLDLAALQSANLTAEVLDPFEEAGRCLAAGCPNAAVAMLRNALAGIVEEKGSETAKAQKDLYNRIEMMATEGALFSTFGEWAHHIRTNGNAGAHQEKFAPVTPEQASELFRFTRELINFLYVQPARLASARGPAKRTP
ncbi:hypothetical protein SEA_MEYRAN_1 [Gordonia phage Meyran]|nr:hypothetical protein SEA_MEYRAN_1 [Gordonia phage Meyran]